MNPYLVIDEIFEIKGRGVVLCGILAMFDGTIKVGQEVEIENIDGSTIKTTIIGIEHICRRTEKISQNFGLLVINVNKEQIQKGAKIKPITTIKENK